MSDGNGGFGVPEIEGLRTRIAKVLCALYSPRCCDECDQHLSQFEIEPYLKDADAVIAELGLREERDWDALQRFGESSPYRIVNRVRYVTDWEGRR